MLNTSPKTESQNPGINSRNHDSKSRTLKICSAMWAAVELVAHCLQREFSGPLQERSDLPHDLMKAEHAEHELLLLLP